MSVSDRVSHNRQVCQPKDVSVARPKGCATIVANLSEVAERQFGSDRV